MEPVSQRGASEADRGGYLVARLVRRLAGALVASAAIIVGCGGAAAAPEAPTDGAAEAITTIDSAATALAPGAPGAPPAPTTPAPTTPKTTEPLVPGAPPVSDVVATPKPEAVVGAVVSSVPQLDARTVKDEVEPTTEAVTQLVSEAKGIADAALTPVSSAVKTVISTVRDVGKAVDGATDGVVEAVTPVVNETVPEGMLRPSDDVDAQEATDADRPASSRTTSAVSSAASIDDAPSLDGGAPEPAAPAPADPPVLTGLVVATSHARRDLDLFPLVTPTAGGVMSDPRPAPAVPFDTPATGERSSNRSRAPPKRSDLDREVAVIEDPPATPRSPGGTNIYDDHDDVPDRTDPIPTSPA